MDEGPQEKLQRCMNRLGELLAPILNAPRQAHETIIGYGLVEACGHVYFSPGWCSPDDLDDLLTMTSDRQRRLIVLNPARRTEKSPGCPICMWERHRQRGVVLQGREN
jgi:hypothetical protein